MHNNGGMDCKMKARMTQFKAFLLAIFPTCLIIGSMLRYAEIQLEEEAQIKSLSAFASEIIRDYYDPIPELWTEFSYLENNAWICARYALSIELGHRFLTYTKAHFPEDHERSCCVRG